VTALRLHLIAVIVGGVCGCAFATVGQPAWAAIAILAGVAAGVVPVDLRERRIPTPLVAPAAIASVASVALTSIDDASWTAAVLAIGGAAVVGAAFLLVHLLHPAGLGFGDVRLATVAGGLVAYGVGNLSAAVATAAIAALAATVVTMAARSRSAPFAPFLLGAALAVLTVAVG
jgi:leader peptidase (prepilin peptidase)/N-methyltransferase